MRVLPDLIEPFRSLIQVSACSCAEACTAFLRNQATCRRHPDGSDPADVAQHKPPHSNHALQQHSSYLSLHSPAANSSSANLYPFPG